MAPNRWCMSGVCGREHSRFEMVRYDVKARQIFRSFWVLFFGFALFSACGGVPASGTPTPDVTLAPTSTPTSSSSLIPVITFIADPPEIQAGACTIMRWHVENAQKVILGGAEQPFDGTYKDCMCKTQRYTLTIVHLDGKEEKRPVTVNVKGSCVSLETPPATNPPDANPPADTSLPPAPSPAIPADGLTLSCRGSQNLVWVPVTASSGIAEYQVQVQRQSGDGNWHDVPGSVFTGISGKSQTILVECGWYYRWQVRAVAGNGSASEWSGWRQFAVTLE
jgi:hypothetical protein